MINKVLGQLRDKYSKGLVSVIVGAGFSRNACKEYPLWQDLLYDMVVELYQDEIERAYLRYRDMMPDNKMSLDVFTKDEAPRIIARVGYLRMVSEYIARKGYREAIEHYIEERIPYIDDATQQFRFAGKNKERAIGINDENFSAHKKLLEGEKWERIYTTNYDRLLEYAVMAKEKRYTIITRAKDLSVGSDKTSIIKLHGDLYDPKERRVFMFDGNPHQQYIISEEDYKNYPKEHEAFTQLMRISLLQGVFCLIGFSGDDPNFVNWISWVRDVLVTGENEEKNGDGQEYKIFLIGMSDKEPDEVRKMFYENHNIVYVPLLRDDVKETIGAKDVEEPRELFCRFFDYLYQSKRIEGKQPEMEATPSRRAYDDLWDKVYKVKHETTKEHRMLLTITIDEEKIGKLYALKPWNRIVTNTHNQMALLRELVNKKEITAAEVKLALLALEDTGLNVDGDFIEKVEAAGVSEPLLEELRNATERTKTVMYSKFADESIEGVATYELILRSLFELDFKRLKELTENWEPDGSEQMKKVLVMSFYDKDRAKELLLAYIKKEPNEKEQYFATRLLNMLEETFPPVHSLDRYINANVQDYFKDLATLVRRCTEKKEKIKGYGAGKHERTYYIGGKPNKLAEGTAVLNFLIETPSFVSYRNYYTMMNSEDWYRVHQIIFERYPLAVMYYGLQCADAKVKMRIGQDYAYSDYLAQNCLDDVLCNLLSAYLSEDTPNYLLESILIVAKELFVSVKPTRWEGLFMQIWENVVLRYRFEDVKNRRFDELDKFVEKALNGVKTQTLRQRIILDVLAHVKDDTGFAINCFYYLHVGTKDIKGNEELKQAVRSFVNEISAPDELNVAGNIYRLLTDEEIDICARKCGALLSDGENKITNIVYHVSEFFVKDKPEMRAMFLKSICENPLLWKNGVLDNHAYGDFTYLKISEFTRRIYIDKDSLLTIYEKLKSSVERLIPFVERHNDAPFFSDTDGLLSEMITFLRQYEKRLYREDGYQSVLSRVVETYHSISGLSKIEDGLLSEYEDDVRRSLKYITANKDTLTQRELEEFMGIVINRVLLKNSDGMDLCISYLWYFLRTGMIDINNERLIGGLVRIADRYRKDDVQACNMDLVATARHLCKIAVHLSKKGLSSEGIAYWKHFQRTSRFYSNFD